MSNQNKSAKLHPCDGCINTKCPLFTQQNLVVATICGDKVIEPPPACPECGHPLAIHGRNGCNKKSCEDGVWDICQCDIDPADLKPAPVHECMHWSVCKFRDDDLCPTECGHLEPYPEQNLKPAEMPLISEERIKETRTYNPTTNGCFKTNEEGVARAQRDADMAWHNEQKALIAKTAVAEFVEKLQKYIDENNIYQVEFEHYEGIKWVPIQTLRLKMGDICQKI